MIMRGLTIAIVCTLASAGCGTATPSTEPTGPTTRLEPPAIADAGPVSAVADATSPPVTPSATTSPALILARAKLKKNDLFAAHVALHSVVNRRISASPADVGEAQLLLVETMYRLKLYAAALAYVQRILNVPGHAKHDDAVNWLVRLARILPHAASLVQKRLNLNAPALRGVRDELLLLMARRALRSGKFSFAISFARRVSTTSAHAEPARLVHWKALRGARKLAAAAKVLQSGFLKGSKFEARANLELARMHWRNKDIPRARRHFNLATATAKKDSAVYITAAFERSAMRLHQRGRLSQLRGIKRGELRNAVYATFCALGPGPDAMFPYRRGKIVSSVLGMLPGKYPDGAALFAAVKAALAGAKKVMKGKPQPAGNQLTLLTLQDERTKRAMAYQAELQRELGVIAAGDTAWQATAAAIEVLQEITLQNALATADAGRRVSQRINSANALAAKLFKQRRQIRRIPVSGRPGRGFHTPKTGCPK